MTLDTKNRQSNSGYDLAGVLVLPAALQQLAAEGDQALVEELIVMFQTDTASRLATLQRAVRARDCLTVNAEAHTIKGSALQVGANSFAGICQELEWEAKKPDSRNLSAILSRLLESFEQVSAVIEARAPRPGSTS